MQSKKCGLQIDQTRVLHPAKLGLMRLCFHKSYYSFRVAFLSCIISMMIAIGAVFLSGIIRSLFHLPMNVG